MTDYPKDSWQAKAARLVSPGYSCCLRCGWPWLLRESHSTYYTPSRACFPLCQDCWGSLTVAERMPYYHRLVFEVWSRSEDWDAVELAVLREGEP